MDKTKEQSQDKRWTDEQIQAIEDKGANLLISAAAVRQQYLLKELFARF